MLRVLATWDPDCLPAPHDVRDLEEEEALGLLPGVNARAWFAMTWDPRADFRPEEDEFDGVEDDEYARETKRGIELRRHPEAMLRDRPHLWAVVGKWRSGVEREVTHERYERATHFELECWLIMLAAHNRALERRMERRGEDDTTAG